MAGQWHYQHGGQNHGPLTSADLKESAVAGKLLPTDLVWKEGMEKWVPAKSVKGLFPAGVAATDKPTPTTQTPAKAVRTGPPPLPDDDDDDDEYRSQAKTRPSRRTLLIAGGSVIGLVVLTLAGLMIFGGRGGNGSNNKTASELMAELRECREKAHREFGGKTFTVTGKVNQVMTDSLYLRGTDKEYGSTVYCQFGSGEFGDAKGRAVAIQQLKGIQPGQAVTLKCEFDKMTGGNTFMKKCQLTEGAGESLVDIVQKCNAHKEAFDKKYAGKRLRITGGVLSKDTMLGDGWSIQFETDTEDHLTVWCKFKAKYDEQLKKVKKGDQVVMDATFKQSAFGSFDHIEMLDGDLITPSDGQRKSARQDDGEDGDVKPAGRGNRAGGANNAGGRTTASNLTQSKLDAMDFDEIMNTLGPPDESYQGTRKKNCKLAVWNSGGGKFITVSYVEPIDGVSPTIVMTKNADRLREVVENLKRITANQ